MTRRLRIGIFVPALLGFSAVLVWGLAGLPDFGNYKGPYGFLLNHVVTPERHATNVVGATVFDYRGVDTMGEEFILFAAVMGVVLLLRSSGRDEEEGEAHDRVRSDAIRVVGTLMVGGGVLVGLWLIAFGYVTPGGGFQGGLAVAAGALMLYLAVGLKAFRPFGNEQIVDPVDAAGAGGYAIIGIAGLVASGSFLHNLFGPGEVGTLWSSGSIALLNWASGLEVAAANLMLFSEFIDQYLVPLSRKQS